MNDPIKRLKPPRCLHPTVRNSIPKYHGLYGHFSSTFPQSKIRSNKKKYLMPFNIICVNERKTLTRASELTGRADLKKNYEQEVQNEREKRSKKKISWKRQLK